MNLKICSAITATVLAGCATNDNNLKNHSFQKATSIEFSEATTIGTEEAKIASIKPRAGRFTLDGEQARGFEVEMENPFHTDYGDVYKMRLYTYGDWKEWKQARGNTIIVSYDHKRLEDGCIKAVLLR